MGFQLSDSVDKNKIYLVKRSELEERFDSSFYDPLKQIFKRKLNANTYTVRLKEIMQEGSYGILPPGDSYDDSFPVLFLRATELKNDFGVDFNSVKKIDKKFLSHKRAIIKDNDILIAVKGATIASAKSVAFIEKAPCLSMINGSIFRLQVKSGVSPLFVAYMLGLELTKQQMKNNLVANNAVDYLDKSLLNNLLVYFPPFLEQKKIVDKMDAAYDAKKAKEAEAQRLLDSIDGYLLQELAIELPKERVNSIQDRMFFRKFSEVSGGRFDAPANREGFSLESLKYQNVVVARLASLNPTTNIDQSKNCAASFIPMEAVSDIYGEVVNKSVRKLSESKGYTTFQDYDLIWAKITPCMENGKSAVVCDLENGIGFGSTEFHVFRAIEGVNIGYLYALLRMKIVRKKAINFFSGSAGHQRVDEMFFKKLLVPKPSQAKQQEIADHIKAICNKAKELRKQAAVDLEQAKQAVEAMILGEDQ